MRYALALVAVLSVPAIAQASALEKAGWYMVVIHPSGNVTVDQHPTTEEICHSQVRMGRQMMGTDALAECVDIEPPR